MSDKNRKQSQLDEYLNGGEDDSDNTESNAREGGQQLSTDRMSIRASEWVEKLRARAIDHDWHLQQGKGGASESTVDQDLLSHTMDVVHITYNLVKGLGIINNPPLDTRTILSVAFFHDLHKRPDIGGTKSMSSEEVDDVLSKWGVGEAVLSEINLQDFTDILRSIHQFHGNNNSRAVVNAESKLFLLTNAIRLADMIASVERLNELGGQGQYQDPFEPLKTITKAVSSVDQEYTLGYHRLSTVRPALSALVHEALYREFTDRGAILLATRADGAVYVVPTSIEIERHGRPDNSDSDIIDAVTDRIQERVSNSDIRDAIPDKLQIWFYGLDGAVSIRINEQRQAIQREETPGHDIDEDIRDVAADLDSQVEDSYDIESIEGTERDVDLISVDNSESTIYIKYPMTEPGEVIGETLSQLMDLIFPIDDEDLPADISSRLDVLAELCDAITDNEQSTVDIEQFESAYYSRIESQLSRVIGNQLKYASNDKAQSILNRLEQRAVALVTGEGTRPDGSQETSRLRSTVRGHVDRNVNICLYHDQQKTSVTEVELPSDVKAGLDYDEACVLCGREASIPFRTGSGEFKKSYLIRGEAGKDMTSANSGAWHLCDVCFLDNALFRASAGNVPSLRNIEDALFLKIIPNRYLSTARVARLRQEFTEGTAFGTITDDAERHLNSEYDLSTEEVVLFNQIDADTSTLAEDYTVDLSGPIADQSGVVIGSPHYFVVAVEDDDDAPTNQETKTWLRALFRALILSRYHNFSVVIGGQPTLSADEYQLGRGGIHLNNPPSQIRSVFGDRIPYTETDLHLTGLCTLIYAEDNFPQYESNNGSFGPNRLTQAYSLFRGSILPGAQMYRAGEREYKPDVPIGDYIDNAGLTAQLLNDWRDRSGIVEDGTREEHKLSTEITNHD